MRKLLRPAVITKKEFEEQLRRVTLIKTEQHFQALPDNFLVKFPKVLDWIKKLYNTKSNFASILKHLLKHKIINEDSDQYSDI